MGMVTLSSFASLAFARIEPAKSTATDSQTINVFVWILMMTVRAKYATAKSNQNRRMNVINYACNYSAKGPFPGLARAGNRWQLGICVSLRICIYLFVFVFACFHLYLYSFCICTRIRSCVCLYCWQINDKRKWNANHLCYMVNGPSLVMRTLCR